MREIVLVAQDSTRYGLDHGVRDGLAYLLRRLGRVDGIRWIRVMYAYPSTLTDPILDAIASEEKVVKYVDIPLQHASEPVLKRMKRPTGRGHLLGMVERIRERVPGWPSGPRSSWASRARPTRTSPACSPSSRPAASTTSASSPSRTRRGRPPSTCRAASPARVKESRRRKLMALQKRISARRNRARVGERVEVLIEGTHPDSDLLLRGRLATQAPEIDGQVIVNDGEAEPGSFVTCEVTEAHPYDLVGPDMHRGSGGRDAPRVGASAERTDAGGSAHGVMGPASVAGPIEPRTS